MKNTLIILTFLTSSVPAKDPTVIKGKLKEVLEKQAEQVPVKEKTKSPKTIQKILSKNLQEDIDQLSFKAFYTKDSIRRLMIEFEKKIFLLEANNDFELKGETYRLQSFDEHKAQLLHIQSKEILTFIYRP